VSRVYRPAREDEIKNEEGVFLTLWTEEGDERDRQRLLLAHGSFG
jgi:hypothetical protein